MPDAARKVVGVGSVGTRARIVLLVGNDENDPLFLGLKEKWVVLVVADQQYDPCSRADAAYPHHLARGVGTRAWIVLLVGNDENDPLFLQAKEAQTSVLEPLAEVPTPATANVSSRVSDSCTSRALHVAGRCTSR